MRETALLYLVLNWLSCTLADSPKENCRDCIEYQACNVAQILLRKQDLASDAKLKNAFCGLDSYRVPMVCCSELSKEDSEEPSEADSVENHPNLRLLPESCGEIKGDRIIGGRYAGLYEFPWMVLLSFRIRAGIDFKCGGSLINERYVLTAAHCVRHQNLAGVRIGDHDFKTSPDCEGEPPNLTCESHIQDIAIETPIPHPEFPSKQYDIALLRLRKPVDFTYKNARAICLPVTQDLRNRKIVGLDGTVAGWGFTETGYVSSKLLAVDVPIHSSENCIQHTKLHNRFKQMNREDEGNNKICAGRLGKDSCDGDSGGPLMMKEAYKNVGHRFIQYGIVSYGPIKCGSGDPGVYTDVTKYMKWILDNIKP